MRAPMIAAVACVAVAVSACTGGSATPAPSSPLPSGPGGAPCVAPQNGVTVRSLIPPDRILSTLNTRTLSYTRAEVLIRYPKAEYVCIEHVEQKDLSTVLTALTGMYSSHPGATANQIVFDGGVRPQMVTLSEDNLSLTVPASPHRFGTVQVQWTRR